MTNVRYESDLYDPMCAWLRQLLADKYKNSVIEIIVEDTSNYYLDTILDKHNVLQYYPQTVGLKIQIDVLGIIKWDNRSEMVFIEAKKTALTLVDLGQLLAYCKLCDPIDAYLLSSEGMGGLKKLFLNMNREDILDYGNGALIKKMKVARWDTLRNTIDSHSIVPKL